MKELYDEVSNRCSQAVSRQYSTSFSLGIRMLAPQLRYPIHSIYGFVRLADEIVDSFHGYDKPLLLARFRSDTRSAIDESISLNPILNAFQNVVHRYGIEWHLIDTFLASMEMDLNQTAYDQSGYEKYILGSAQVVGLMCLRVFANGDADLHERLKPYAMSLGSAFQKVNFLRDAGADFETLGRVYFPGVDFANFSPTAKQKIEADIQADFQQALLGIRQLPANCRLGVFVAFTYYRRLFQKIKKLPAPQVLSRRVRIANFRKMGILCQCFIRHSLRSI